MPSITWTCQTFGDVFDSDRRPVGVFDVQTVDCDQTNVCNVEAPAPWAVLVFLLDQAPAESDQGLTMMFPITACTELHNTATADPAVLATSNRNKDIADALADTSQCECISDIVGPAYTLPSIGALVAATLLVSRMSTRQ